MEIGAVPISTSQVVEAVTHDAPFLFLGSAFVTAGLISAAFAFLGRRFNAMLLWLACFSALYGVRLWLQLPTLHLMLLRYSGFATLQAAINYLVPVPVAFFFDIAGFLGRFGRRIAIAISVFFVSLFTLALISGPNIWIDRLNSAVVIVSLSALLIYLFQRHGADRDFAVTRWGLTIFVALAVFDNLGDFLGFYPRVEPIGCSVFLMALGYVAARRSLHRDEQLAAVQKELDLARNIQMAILPSAYPNSAHFRVAARYVPMTSVAGDFYDFPIAGDSQAGLLIGDVAGHGVPAALIASMVKLAAVSQGALVRDPAAFLAGMNAVLCGQTQNQFVTAAYLYLDADSGTLSYSAAAHPPMLLLREGSVTRIEENGLMLAAFSFATYATKVHSLAPGDRLLLYTDGLVEAMNRDGVEFGLPHLESLLLESGDLSPDQAADQILRAVGSWSAAQNDDLTVLICNFQSSRNAEGSSTPGIDAAGICA